jgi:hypothetical protein
MTPYFYGRTVDVPPSPLRLFAYEIDLRKQNSSTKIKSNENRIKNGA